MKLRVKSKIDEMARRCAQSGQTLTLGDFNEIDRKIVVMFYPDHMPQDVEDVAPETGLKQENCGDTRVISELQSDNGWFLLPESNTIDENGFRITRIVSEYGDNIVSEEALLIDPAASTNSGSNGQCEVEETVPPVPSSELSTEQIDGGFNDELEVDDRESTENFQSSSNHHSEKPVPSLVPDCSLSHQPERKAASRGHSVVPRRRIISSVIRSVRGGTECWCQWDSRCTQGIECWCQWDSYCTQGKSIVICMNCSHR